MKAAGRDEKFSTVVVAELEQSLNTEVLPLCDVMSFACDGFR